MFGPSFLVNPVTQEMSSLAAAAPGKNTRKVYLPKSSDWFDFWTGKILSGGETFDAPAPIETIPLYVKAGSIVPMGPFLQYATEKAADPIELRIYPGANGRFVLYEDANDNYNYEKGEYATIEFEWNNDARTLSISDRKGSFPGMLKERMFNIVLVKPSHGTGVDVSPQPDKSVNYDGRKIEVNLQ